MTGTDSPPGRIRLLALDTLRFLAASVVIVAHARDMHPYLLPWRFFATWLFQPKSAVAFFFVLSGFVLHLSWKGAWPKLRGWAAFMVKRVFRLYPLYFLSLPLGLLVLGALPLAQSEWYALDPAWKEIIDQTRNNPVQWVHHFLLVTPGLDMNFLNPPIWTLAAEMRVAFVFPWLSWLVKRLPMGWGLVTSLVSMIVLPLVAQRTLPTVGLLPLFMLGAWGAQHQARLTWLKSGKALLVLVVGLAIYCAGPEMRGTGTLTKAWHLQISGTGALLTMLAILRLPFLVKILERPFLVFGGHASYGLYALHFPIFMGLAYFAWKGDWSATTFFLIGFSVTLALAAWLYRTVELPMIRMGGEVVKRWVLGRKDPNAPTLTTVQSEP